MTNTAATYGDSLYDLAAEEKLTDEMLKDVELVNGLFKENPDYIRLLNEPSVSKAERIKLIDDAFKGNVHQYLLNFIKILCENGTIGQYSGCVSQFKKRYNADRNISEAVVTTAKKLSDDQLIALKEKLEKITGKVISITEKVDERFIAGLKVEIDGTLYDGSAYGRLNALKKKVDDIII